MSILFSQNFNTCSSFKRRDHASQAYKTTAVLAPCLNEYSRPYCNEIRIVPRTPLFTVSSYQTPGLPRYFFHKVAHTIAYRLFSVRNKIL